MSLGNMKFRGLYTAVLTPFCDSGGRIDYDAYQRLIERQIEAGVAGVVPCGTTGESPTLSHEEHRKLISFTVRYTEGKCSVIAGTGSNSTKEAVDLTEAACKDGADAVMLVSPYYNKPTQEGLYKHFQEVANSSSVPVMIYNIKGRTGVNISVETMERLSNHERIQAVKEASGDPVQMIRIKKVCGNRISMLCGDDNITPAFMGLGGDGVVSVASNIYPKRMVQMMSHYLEGDFTKGNTVFYEMVGFMNALFWETNPIPVKTAGVLAGICSDDLRLPLTSMNADLKNQLEEIMKYLGEDI